MWKLKLFCFLVSSIVAVNSLFCKVDKECNQNLVCINGICSCKLGQILSTDGNHCLDMAYSFGSACEENKQCTALLKGDVICTKDGLCGCNKGFRPLNDACLAYRGFNETCEENYDCYDEVDLYAMKCKDKICICNDEYYLRGGVDCRPSAKETKQCFLDVDCQSDEEFCKFEYDLLGNCTLKTNNSTNNADPSKQNFIYEIETVKNTITNLKSMNLPCKKDEDCKTVANSFCQEYQRQCLCKDSHIYDNNLKKCVKVLGSSCDTKDECGMRHSICNKEKKCQCEKYFISGSYNEKCFKPVRAFNNSCGRDNNCFSFGNHGSCQDNKCICNSQSEMDEDYMLCRPLQINSEDDCEDNCISKPYSSCQNNRCVCNENYLSKNDKCYPDIGYECSVINKDCLINNAECNEEICACKKGYLQGDNRNCVPELSQVEDECNMDVQCKQFLGQGGICYNNNCTCLSEYDRQKNTCILKRSFGDECYSLAECKTILNNDNVVCRNKKCTCDYGYKITEDKTQCFADNGSSALTTKNFIYMIVLCLSFLFRF